MRWANALRALILGAALTPLAATAAHAETAPPDAALFPVHGMVLARVGGDRAVVRLDPVTMTEPGLTRISRIDPAQGLTPGTPFDAFADAKHGPGVLFDAKPAAQFVAGTPDAFATHVLDVGDPLPNMPLIDQNGHVTSFARFAGKTTIISFVFTRCPDLTICPAISGKFLYLQQHLDPALFHLVEVTLDPTYDSPAALKAYGKQFGAIPASWSLVTGEPAQIKTLIDQFGISSIEDRPGNYVHDDRLVVAAPNGKIASVLQTIGWSPDDAIALARDVAGLDSNPFRRFYLATVSNVVALCGGGSSIGVVLLDSSLFIIGFVVLGGATIVIGRLILTEKI